jgi:hypothetical protein
MSLSKIVREFVGNPTENTTQACPLCSTRIDQRIMGIHIARHLSQSDRANLAVAIVRLGDSSLAPAVLVDALEGWDKARASLE